MAENASQMKVSDLFVDPTNEKQSFDSEPVYKQIVAEKLKQKKSQVTKNSESKDMLDFDIVPVLQENTKTIKTMQFELEMMISSGLQHELINRFSGTYTHLDIVEGTFKMYKIEIRKLISPMKLFIKYKTSNGSAVDTHAIKTSDSAASKNDRDLRIIYSYTNSKPEAHNCDGVAENVSCLTLHAADGERYFSKEFVFLKFETISGQQARMKLQFPR